MGFFYLKIILLFFLLCYNSGVMVLYIGGVLMAYFLKVTKQQSRTYLSIYESFYSPETKGTKHRSYRSLVLNAKLNKKKNKENSQNKRKSLIKVNE